LIFFEKVLAFSQNAIILGQCDRNVGWRRQFFSITSSKQLITTLDNAMSKLFRKAMMDQSKIFLPVLAAAIALFANGAISRKSTMEAFGIDYDKERKELEKEMSDGRRH